MGWIKSEGRLTSEEALKDIAKVVSCYVDGVGIRISMNAISHYGDGYRFLSDFARFSDVPVISMAGDRFHPCQGLSDLLGWAERYSEKRERINMNSLKGKTLLLTWGSSGFARPWASVQSHLLLAARFGMNVRLAYPRGYDLDPEITERAQHYCSENNTQYEVIHNPNAGYEGANVVYVRNWVSNNAYQEGCFQYESEIKRALNLKEWIVTEAKMRKTENALFANPMPVDRGREAEDVVVDGKNSVIYEVAANRRHVQKALLATVMGS